MHSPIILALLTAVAMACGQLLFKFGAERWRIDSLSQAVLSFISNPFLVSAVLLYAVTILLWIYVLKVLPLSLAYPLTALSYVLVPLLCWAVLGEKVSSQTLLGSTLIIAGVLVCHWQRG